MLPWGVVFFADTGTRSRMVGADTRTQQQQAMMAVRTGAPEGPKRAHLGTPRAKEPLMRLAWTRHGPTMTSGDHSFGRHPGRRPGRREQTDGDGLEDTTTVIELKKIF